MYTFVIISTFRFYNLKIKGLANDNVGKEKNQKLTVERASLITYCLVIVKLSSQTELSSNCKKTNPSFCHAATLIGDPEISPPSLQ